MEPDLHRTRPYISLGGLLYTQGRLTAMKSAGTATSGSTSTAPTPVSTAGFRATSSRFAAASERRSSNQESGGRPSARSERAAVQPRLCRDDAGGAGPRSARSGPRCHPTARPGCSRPVDRIRLAVAPGDPVPERFRRDIEADGEDLWRLGALLPRVRASDGSTLDPRYYAGMCRLSGVFAGVPVWPELQEAHPYTAHPPPSHLRADAIIVASVLENAPLRLTQAGVVRRDDHRRFLATMGDDEPRWSLAWTGLGPQGLPRGRPDLERLPRVQAANDCRSPSPSTIRGCRGRCVLLRVAGARGRPGSSPKA